MEIAIIVLVVLILIGVKAYVDQRNYKKRLRTRLLREWGRPSEDEYGIEKLQTVAEYFRAHESDQSIDDITWNDLDMDTVYQQMNHTKSAMGQEYLYALLHNPQVDAESLKERERLISFFMENEKARFDLQQEFAAIGKGGNFSVYGYLDRVGMLQKENGISSVIQMLAGEGVRINTGTFSNDMTTFATKDDVLTLLVHLGYLTYNSETEKVTIPNKEVSQEYLNAISTMDWHEVMRSVENSRKLVEALWNQDAKAVAAGIENVHDEISILQYHDENSLSCTIHLAFYFAREYYTIIRELPTGKGFADICMIPRKIHADKPAVIIELKWDKDAEGAIAQIKEKKYVKSLEDYKGNLLLAGINYDKKTKTHTCVIEKVEL